MLKRLTPWIESQITGLWDIDDSDAPWTKRLNKFSNVENKGKVFIINNMLSNWFTASDFIPHYCNPLFNGLPDKNQCEPTAVDQNHLENTSVRRRLPWSPRLVKEGRGYVANSLPRFFPRCCPRSETRLCLYLPVSTQSSSSSASAAPQAQSHRLPSPPVSGLHVGVEKNMNNHDAVDTGWKRSSHVCTL